MKQLNLDLGYSHDERYGIAAAQTSPGESYPSFTYSGSEELDLPESGKMVIEFEETRSEESKRNGKKYYECTIRVKKILGVEGAKKSPKAVKAADALDAIKEALEAERGDDDDDDGDED